MSSKILWRCLHEKKPLKEVPLGTRQLFGLVTTERGVLYNLYYKLYERLSILGTEAENFFFDLAWQPRQTRLVELLAQVSRPTAREKKALRTYVSIMRWNMNELM